MFIKPRLELQYAPPPTATFRAFAGNPEMNGVTAAGFAQLRQILWEITGQRGRLLQIDIQETPLRRSATELTSAAICPIYILHEPLDQGKGFQLKG